MLHVEILVCARNDDLIAVLSFDGLSRGQALRNAISLPEGCAEGSEGRDDLVAEGVGFFVFEVRVHTPELEGDGEGVESIGDAFAFVDIEEPVSFEIGATGGENCSFYLSKRNIFFDEDGDVAAGGGISGNAVVGRDTGDLVLEGIEREFRHDGGSGEAGRFGNERVDLPEQADFLVAENDLGASGGMEAGVGCVAFECYGEVDAVGDLFEGAFQGEKVSG